MVPSNESVAGASGAPDVALADPGWPGRSGRATAGRYQIGGEWLDRWGNGITAGILPSSA